MHAMMHEAPAVIALVLVGVEAILDVVALR